MVVLNVERGGQRIRQVETGMTHAGQGSDNRTNKEANPHAPSARQACPFANGPTFPRCPGPTRETKKQTARRWRELVRCGNYGEEP